MAYYGGGILRIRQVALREAAKFLEEGKGKEAAAQFSKAAQAADQIAKNAVTMKDSREWLDIARGHREDAARAAGSSVKRSSKAGSPGSSGEGRVYSEGEGDSFRDAIEGLIQTPEQIKVRWEDIGGLADVKRDMKFSYGMALAPKPEGISLPIGKNFLMYGPPGTGKTLLAAAMCAKFHGTFYNVKVSSLLSKYFGESPKMVSALFDHARQRARDEGVVMIFIDEFHSLVPSEGGDESGAERRLLSTILAEMDGLSEKGNEPPVFVLGATNHPSKLHAAALSRFQRRFLIPLPDPAAREEILKIQLAGKGLQLASRGDQAISLKDLVGRTEAFSGRDLARLCAAAVMSMLQEANPGIPAAVDRGADAVAKHQVKVTPLSRRHFEDAFGKAQVDRTQVAACLAECDSFAKGS
ncbi:MAG: ATP-binding protein [Pseudomonadota bacterium]